MEAQKKIRFCFLIGAPKAGTTSLFYHLSKHPQIAPCRDKEPNFFTIHYEKGYDWYLSFWEPGSIENKILLAATTNLTYASCFPDGARNMLDFSKKHPVSYRFLYILRNPFDRIESHYTYRRTYATGQSLDEVLEGKHIMIGSQYAYQLDPYAETFGRENILLMDFDEMKQNPTGVLKRICEFLEIDSSFEFPDIEVRYNVSKGMIITRPVNVMYEKFPWIRKLSEWIPKRLKMAVLRTFFPSIKKNFKLTKAQRQRVYDFIRDDMARLRDRYGVDVSRWGF